MSGYSIWGHDTGGYQDTHFSVSRPNLFMRWAQFGCFSPLMQMHRQVAQELQYPWRYGDEALHNFQFFAQLGKSAPVGDFGLLVEHLARVTQTADTDPRLFEILIPARQAVCELPGFIIIALARDSSSQIEHVEFGRGMTQQMGEVAEPLSVL